MSVNNKVCHINKPTEMRARLCVCKDERKSRREKQAERHRDRQTESVRGGGGVRESKREMKRGRV